MNWRSRVKWRKEATMEEMSERNVWWVNLHTSNNSPHLLFYKSYYVPLWKARVSYYANHIYKKSTAYHVLLPMSVHEIWRDARPMQSPRPASCEFITLHVVTAMSESMEGLYAKTLNLLPLSAQEGHLWATRWLWLFPRVWQTRALWRIWVESIPTM